MPYGIYPVPRFRAPAVRARFAKALERTLDDARKPLRFTP